jgi:hypothetical protein
LKYVSIPAKKCLAQRKNSSLPVTLGVGRIHPSETSGFALWAQAVRLSSIAAVIVKIKSFFMVLQVLSNIYHVCVLGSGA